MITRITLTIRTIFKDTNIKDNNDNDNNGNNYNARKNKQRKRNTIRFEPPFSKNVRLKLGDIDKHF